MDIRQSLLQFAIHTGRFTVLEASEGIGLSITTVAKHLDKLIGDGYLEAFDSQSTGSRGRKPVIYGVKSDSLYFVGVDIKAFELNIGLMNFSGEMVKKRQWDDYRFENTYANLDGVCERILQFIREGALSLDADRIAGVSFNISGRVNSRKGTSASVFNFEETQDAPLTEILEEKLGMKVFIENDSKAMAYGEYRNLENKDSKNLLYINIGWGLGMGIILGGELYYGSTGFSGELGHAPFYKNDILCHCGKKGCIETEISINAIQRKLIERINNGESSVLSRKVIQGAKISSKDILSALEKEDPLCIELVSRTGTELGKILAGMINIFNPDTIMIGGKLAKAAPYYFLQFVSLAIKQYSLKLISQNVNIMTSRLGDDAGITGACLIARDRVIFQTGI